MMVDYPVADELQENPAAWCAALVVSDTRASVGGSLVPEPDASLRNGTLTFVKSGGRTIGITCQHVIDYYRRALAESGVPGSHTLRTMVNGFYVVGDTFWQPPAQWPDPPPDIAMREVDPAFVGKIGKRAFDLDAMQEPPADIQHAMATGFPEGMKYHKFDDGPGYRVSMPQVSVLAELERCPTRRFTMFSVIPKPRSDVSYSGMSGGPICWSDDQENFGLLGIVYEGGSGEDNESIYVYGELATPALLKTWIEALPALPRRRDARPAEQDNSSTE